MTPDRIGLGAITTLVVAAVFFVAQLCLLVAAVLMGTFLMLVVHPLLSPFAPLAQSLVLTPAACIWLLGRTAPQAKRRRRTIKIALVLSAFTYCLTLSTWYVVFTAPYQEMHIFGG